MISTLRFTATSGCVVAIVLFSAIGTVQSQVIDFEDPPYTASDITDPAAVNPPLIGQDGWVIGTDQSVDELAVLLTANSGQYVGGQAAGHVDTGGNSRAGRLGASPAIGNTMTADFFANDPDADGPDSNVRLFPFFDLNDDGVFDHNTSDGERQFGFGFDSNATFHIRPANSTTDINSATMYEIDTWYRISATWTAPDGDGLREMSLSVVDLTNNNDLGEVLQAVLTAEEFGVDPVEYDGVAVRITRGAIDNVLVVPEPTSCVLLGLGSFWLFVVFRMSRSTQDSLQPVQ